MPGGADPGAVWLFHRDLSESMARVMKRYGVSASLRPHCKLGNALACLSDRVEGGGTQQRPKTRSQ